MQIIKCTNLKKIYGNGDNQVLALDDINLSIDKGEFVAVVGASGSGKSTLLHILGTVDKASEGNVMVDGIELSSLNKTQAAIFRRRSIGLVFQFYNLIPTVNIRKNIIMPLLLDKKKVDEDYFAFLVKTLGIEDKLEMMPLQLSGGQQQRAAIARALLYRPAILLADEPTGNLDKKNTMEVIKLLKQLNCELKQTMLVITHDEQIAKEASRVIEIEDGHIIKDGQQG